MLCVRRTLEDEQVDLLVREQALLPGLPVNDRHREDKLPPAPRAQHGLCVTRVQRRMIRLGRQVGRNDAQMRATNMFKLTQVKKEKKDPLRGHHRRGRDLRTTAGAAHQPRPPPGHLD